MAQTDRLGLPLLATAQAQKEMTLNEALALLDSAVQAVVLAIAPSTVPASPSPGQSWIVGAGASGAWTGHDGALASWTSGGWRFVAPFEGMAVWSLADDVPARHAAGVWEIGTLKAARLFVNGDQVVGVRQPAIADPAGGSTVDVEARDAISQLIDALKTHGLIEI
jgi:hypothetical protein